MVQLANRLFTIILSYLAIMIIQPSVTKAAHEKFALSSNSTTTDLQGNRCSQMLCSESKYKCFLIDCSPSGPGLPYAYCATFNADTKLLSVSSCRYFEPERYNITSSKHTLLPRNLCQLNDHMCSPLNRKGFVCSECADGFGPSVTSFRHRCVRCTGTWYGVPLFLFITFAPITVFYSIVLIFQIKVLTAPMPCFIMYAQFIVVLFDADNYTSFIDPWNHTLDIKIMLMLYGIFNFSFDHLVDFLQPYCLSENLNFFHLALLNYIAAFYPIALIFLTWLCVELHGRNFRPLVWLWKPFHRCFVRLRRGWNIKSDIIDVFTTLFLLSYNKILYQTFLLIGSKGIKNFSESGSYFTTYHSQLDLSISIQSTHLLTQGVLVTLIAILCLILPPLLLILYPIKRFRLFLSKCHINFVAIHIFMDKVYSCYKDGLNGGRDMRSFSGLYFVLRITAYLCAVLSHLMKPFLHINHWFAIGTLLFFATLAVAIAKPYRKAYMNYWDTAILSHITILLFVISSGSDTLLLAKILLNIPIVILIIAIVLRKGYNMCKLQKCFTYFKVTEADNQTEVDPLIIQSTFSNYGAKRMLHN